MTGHPVTPSPRHLLLLPGQRVELLDQRIAATGQLIHRIQGDLRRRLQHLAFLGNANLALDRILEVRPKLAIPLAQSVPGVRRQIVQRIIRRGALLTAALGCDPIPLLDLPLQIALNWKVALQVAAIYGRPSLDVGSREMMGTVGISLALRLAAQQLLKLMPLVGWGLSAGASGASTWLLGRALVRYYEQERLVTPALFVERGLRLLRQRCGRLR